MKKSELKRIIKPMVAECIKESLLEGGILSSVISEVVKGMNMNMQLMTEQEAPVPSPKESLQAPSKKMQETKQQMLRAIGSDAYNGVNLFEGTTPAPAPQSGNNHGPLRDADPTDAGVDISGLLNRNWSKLV
jgi:hypothetical protein